MANQGNRERWQHFVKALAMSWRTVTFAIRIPSSDLLIYTRYWFRLWSMLVAASEVAAEQLVPYKAIYRRKTIVLANLMLQEAQLKARIKLAAIGTRLVRPDQVDAPVLDIRQTAEFAAGHLPGARHVELGELADRAQDVPTEPLVVMCGHGERAMSAASLLERVGHRDFAVLTGGPDDWATATGHRLETGT